MPFTSGQPLGTTTDVGDAVEVVLVVDVVAADDVSKVIEPEEVDMTVAVSTVVSLVDLGIMLEVLFKVTVVVVTPPETGEYTVAVS